MTTMWAKLTKQGLLGAYRSKSPQQGIWISSLRSEGFQHTVEHIAKDGTVIHAIHCYCGQDRSNALRLAQKLAKEAK